MKKLGSMIMCAALAVPFALHADYVMYVNNGETLLRSEKCEDVDSVKVNASQMSVFKGAKTYPYDLAAQTDINVTFEKIVGATDTVFITYGTEVTVKNPYKETVMISVDGNNVAVSCANQLKDVVYVLSGSSDNGSFLIETPRKFTVVLDNLSLVSKGVLPAIYSLSSSSMEVKLPENSISTLADSEADTCNATLRSKGQIFFTGAGTLNVAGNAKRAIQTGDYIQVEGGNIVAMSNLGDAVRAKDYIRVNGGSLTANAGGIEVTKGFFELNGGLVASMDETEDVKLIKVEADSLQPLSLTNGAFIMNGGELLLGVYGAGGKGVKTMSDIILNGGTVTAEVNASALDDGFDVSYAAALKADRFVKIGGLSQVTVAVSEGALGGRGIAADSGIVVTDTAIVDLNMACAYYEDADKEGYGFKSDGPVTFDGSCQVTVISSDGNKSAACVKSDEGLTINGKAQAKLVSAKSTAVKCGVTLNGGYLIAAAAGKTALKSDASHTFNGGTYVGLGSAANGLNAKSKLGGIIDASYQAANFRITNASGEEISFDSSAMPYSGKVLQVVSDIFTPGETYTYNLGGTPYTFTAPAAAKSVTITK